AGSERGRIYGFILAGELVGAGIGFSLTGEIAVLSWRAAFVVLAIPALVLAWMVAHLPEPERGGRALLSRGTEQEADEEPRETDAQRLARERLLAPDPSLVPRGDLRR